MTMTVSKLIENLQAIADKEQVVVGEIWIAEDFTYENEDGEEVTFTSQELAEVAEYRSVSKSLGYVYDEVLEFLTENKEDC